MKEGYLIHYHYDYYDNGGLDIEYVETKKEAEDRINQLLTKTKCTIEDIDLYEATPIEFKAMKKVMVVKIDD